MALNYIWLLLIFIGFLTACIQWISGSNSDIFSSVVQSIFDMSKTSVDISIYLVGVMTFWLGIMKVGEKGGAISIISKLISPILQPFFPEIPKNHPAMGSMIMNISANMLGLDNAATPLGLKAMKELQDINPEKERANNAQIMFLVLNASGLTIIPVSILALRGSMGAQNPSDVFLPILLATACSTLASVALTSLIQKINIWKKEMIAPVLVLSFLLAIVYALLVQFGIKQIAAHSSSVGNLIILLFILFFLLLSFKNKLNTYNDFVEGAKEGFSQAIGIIPYLVAMLVAVGIFRASGALDYLLIAFQKIFYFISPEITQALPTAFMKPLSGSGARGMMVDAMTTYGADSFTGRLACIFQGSTETTFYVLSVYFGFIQVKNTRYALWCGLFADLIGFLAAIAIALYFFN